MKNSIINLLIKYLGPNYDVKLIIFSIQLIIIIAILLLEFSRLINLTEYDINN